MKRLGVWAWVGVLLASGSVSAAETDPRLVDLSATPSGLVSLELARTAGHLEWFGTLSTHFVHEEFQVTFAGQDFKGPLQRRMVTQLSAGVGLFDRLEIALALPLQWARVNTPYDRNGRSTAEWSLADLRLLAKGALIERALSGEGLGLAIHAQLTFPTGGTNAFATEGGFSVTPGAALDYRFSNGATLAMSVGYRVRGEERVAETVVGHEVRYGLGGELPIGVLNLSALAELVGSVGLGEDTIDAESLPLELLAGLRWRHESSWSAHLGVGVGLTAGYGSPNRRVLFSLGYGFGPAPAEVAKVERVTYGIAAESLEAPAPVHFEATEDGVTSKGAAAKPPSQEILAAAAAEPDPDRDGDGLGNDADKCPDAAEDRDGFQDEDGCPELDNDGDGVPDDKDQCADAKETVNGVDDEDGCPDEGAAKVAAVGDRIELKEKVMFKSASDQLTPESVALLAQVAAVLNAAPHVTLVRIEGHTDGAGDKEFNVHLSERRAHAVRRALIDKSVAPERLVAKGYGPSRPIADNGKAEGRAANRRVELHIVEQRTREGAPQGGAK